MSALKVSLLGLILGLSGYAICALAFWYGFLSLTIGSIAVILGIAFLGLAIVSGIALVIVLIIMLATRLDHGAEHHG